MAARLDLASCRSARRRAVREIAGSAQRQVVSIDFTVSLRAVWKPAYIFRPQQLATRFSRARCNESVRLPWGGPLVVSKNDVIGRGLIRVGVWELATTEVLWRLTTPDDLAVDLGANVGYFTSLFAHRASHVVSFEPHPVHVERLQRAMSAWPNAERVEMWPNAVSDSSGEATLGMPENFGANEGQASLSLDGKAGDEIIVQSVTLDRALGNRRVGVMKIDVEGHELAVLRGAEHALAQGRIRDIVFEDHVPLPTDVSRYLTNRGYTILGLSERMMGVDLVAPEHAPPPLWSAPMYLATLDPDRARRLMAPRRWRSLRP